MVKHSELTKDPSNVISVTIVHVEKSILMLILDLNILMQDYVLSSAQNVISGQYLLTQSLLTTIVPQRIIIKMF